MKITLDRSADAVYIYLTQSNDEEIVKTYPCDPLEVGGQINLDFDRMGHLIGIEVMGASNKLPSDLLANAEIIE